MAYVINFHFYKHFYRSSNIFQLLKYKHSKKVQISLILDSSPQYSPNHRANFFSFKRLSEIGIKVKMQQGRQPQHSN